ncbi:DUF2753 family protein [Vibrio salinus]|uniref:DUF2753 family protein n=1 Tax=Vibrio salinus TaxID=2899784 RepID=UPI001E5BD524|nr:DUF2753 family protein [Vibrio salinus]MCE0493874.1 DUF2753 domain-containing protein [Vibrio salinus]
MSISQWEKHTLIAANALQAKDYETGVLHYQKALTISDELLSTDTIALDDRLMISIYSCHNLAALWRDLGDKDYELKYLQLASEKVLMLTPQCGNDQCELFIESLGCCKKALIEHMKNHPNPDIANLVQNIESAYQCNMIARFKLN